MSRLHRSMRLKITPVRRFAASLHSRDASRSAKARCFSPIARSCRHIPRSTATDCFARSANRRSFSAIDRFVVTTNCSSVLRVSCDVLSDIASSCALARCAFSESASPSSAVSSTRRALLSLARVSETVPIAANKSFLSVSRNICLSASKSCAVSCFSIAEVARSDAARASLSRVSISTVCFSTQPVSSETAPAICPTNRSAFTSSSERNACTSSASPFSIRTASRKLSTCTSNAPVASWNSPS
mmetsp:Transcript_8346/g.27805  ORF Transcript_8346/g.27805 Transcript_8346/m.27805 type:complete len:244 (+) Transcript_8346:758-1489(+)